MKKLVSITLALMLLLSATMTAVAAEVKPGTASSNTTVSYTTTNATYVVTIPDSLTLSGEQATGASATLTVSAAGVMLTTGDKLQVTATSDGILENGSSQIKYTAKIGTDSVIDGSYKILDIAAGTAEASATITVEATKEEIAEATLTGAHTDVITFNVAVVTP